MIISASRRTDIPAYYGEWLMNRLRAGYCDVANPFNPKQVSRVSLRPEDVDAVVFWTKHVTPFLSSLDEIDARRFRTMFLYTLNAYPKPLEPGLPTTEQRTDTFRTLASRLGARRVVWRYDPIILSRQITADYHLDTFASLASQLRGSTQRVIISFVDFYRKTARRLSRLEEETGDAFCRETLDHPDLPDLVRGLKDAAAANGMEIQSCCEDPRVAELGIKPGKCIDDEWIRSAFGIDVPSRKDPGQRPGCRCVVSKDIGAPNTCLCGCPYCYATSSDDAARRRHARHDPESPMLVGPGDRNQETGDSESNQLSVISDQRRGQRHE